MKQTDVGGEGYNFEVITFGYKFIFLKNIL